MADAQQMGGYTHVPDDKLVHQTYVHDLYRCLDPAVSRNGRSTITNTALFSREASDYHSEPLRKHANSVPELQSSPKVDWRQRKKREFIPEDQKDCNYWSKRKRNNEAAKRSRHRRRMEEVLLEARAVELLRENEKLKATLSAVQCSSTPESRCNRSVDNRNMSPHFFHPFSNELPPPSRIPSRASSVGMHFRIANDVQENKLTHCSGFINMPCFSSVDNFKLKRGNGSDVLPRYQVDLPGSMGVFSGASVINHYDSSAETIFYGNHVSAATAGCFGHEPNRVNNTSDNSGMSKYRCLNGLASHRNSTYEFEHNPHCKTVNLESTKQDPISEAKTHITSSTVDLMMKDEVREDRKTAETTGVLAVFSLPHKLRYKFRKALEGPAAKSRTLPTAKKEIINEALTQTSETTFNCTDSKTMTLPEASSTSLSVTSNEMKDDEHLKKQLASLCAEVKHLKQFLLAKLN